MDVDSYVEYLIKNNLDDNSLNDFEEYNDALTGSDLTGSEDHTVIYTSDDEKANNFLAWLSIKAKKSDKYDLKKYLRIVDKLHKFVSRHDTKNYQLDIHCKRVLKEIQQLLQVGGKRKSLRKKHGRKRTRGGTRCGRNT